MSPSDRHAGVYGKYKIEKSDGSESDPHACYFVLRLDTDKHARTAMRLYADLVGGELGDQIAACVRELQRAPCGCRAAACEHEPIFSRVWMYGEPPR